MAEKTVRLLLTAGIWLMIAGCIFGFISQWIYAALVWADRRIARDIVNSFGNFPELSHA